MGEGKLPNQVVRERIAQLLRTESRRWGLKPEGIHPLKGAIQNGKMGSCEERRAAIREESQEVALFLIKLAQEALEWSNPERTTNYLRMVVKGKDASLEDKLEAAEILELIDSSS